MWSPFLPECPTWHRSVFMLGGYCYFLPQGGPVWNAMTSLKLKPEEQIYCCQMMLKSGDLAVRYNGGGVDFIHAKTDAKSSPHSIILQILDTKLDYEREQWCQKRFQQNYTEMMQNKSKEGGEEGGESEASGQAASASSSIPPTPLPPPRHPASMTTPMMYPTPPGPAAGIVGTAASYVTPGTPAAYDRRYAPPMMPPSMVPPPMMSPMMRYPHYPPTPTPMHQARFPPFALGAPNNNMRHPVTPYAQATASDSASSPEHHVDDEEKDDNDDADGEPKKKATTVFTEEKRFAALENARLRGLPDGWTLEWDGRRKVWVSPDGLKRCNGVPAALEYSVKMGLVSPGDLPPPNLSEEEQIARESERDEVAMAQALTTGLPKGWILSRTSNTKKRKREWISPDGKKKCRNLTEALAWSVDNGLIKADAVPASLKRKLEDRVITSEEREAALAEAKSKGLPGGWSVEYNSKRWGGKLWTSPEGKKCYTLPEALVLAGIIKPQRKNRVLTEEEVNNAMDNARQQGLPDGWQVEFCNKRRSKVWISPDGRKCKTVPEALAMSVEMGLLSQEKLPEAYKDRELTPEEKEHALKEGKAKGLPDGWDCVWNAKRNQKVKWVAPDGRVFCTIPQALAYSVKIGLLSEDKLPTSQRNRTLSLNEVKAAMGMAKERGLPDGWKVEYDNRRRAKTWISPDGQRRCLNIPEALAASVEMGILAEDKLPESYKNRVFTEAEKRTALAKAKSKGLPDGWDVAYNNKQRCKTWISPSGKKCDSLSEALAVSVDMGLISADKLPQSRQHRVLTPEEVKSSLDEAKARGLPIEGWSVVWCNKARARRWISPDGKKCDGILKALQKSVQMGLLPKEKLPADCQDKVKTPEERRAAKLKQVLEAARTKGLPNAWTVEYIEDKQRNEYVSPDGRRYRDLNDALVMLVKAGEVSTDVLPPSQQHRVEVTRPPTKEEKVEAAKEKAKERGLPDSWTIEFCEKKSKVVYRSPDGKRTCTRLNGALVVSVDKGLLSSEKLPASYKEDRSLTLEEVEKALAEAKAKGLPDTFGVEWDNQKRRRVWCSPDGAKLANLPDAIAHAKKIEEEAKAQEDAGSLLLQLRQSSKKRGDCKKRRVL